MFDELLLVSEGRQETGEYCLTFWRLLMIVPTMQHVHPLENQLCHEVGKKAIYPGLQASQEGY